MVTVQNIRYISRRRELYSVVPTTDQSLSLAQRTDIPKVVSIDKPDVSPVLKQTLTFTLQNYADTLNAADLKVKVLNAAVNYERDLYVMSVDNTAKTFTVKFNGAPINTYKIWVYANSASQYGILDTSAVSIMTSSTVSNITPTQGSVLGGSILTITGTNFSAEKTDQAVTVAGTWCDILTVTTTQITCRIRNTGRAVDAISDNNDVVVTLAASSESTCTAANNCKFAFKTPVATLTTVAVSTSNPN